MDKNERQRLILSIVKSKLIGNHDQLVKELLSVGASVTQSSVSRDLKELNVSKKNGYYFVNEENLDLIGQPFDIFVQKIGENLLVVKTRPGEASRVALIIDNQRFEAVAGTIAGDDTIFIAVQTSKSQEYVTKKILELFS